MSTKETDKDSSKRDTSLLTEKDLRQFKRLLSLIKGSGLEEVSIKLGDLSIRARRSGSRFSARRIESVDTSEALSAPLVSSFSPKEEVVSAILMRILRHRWWARFIWHRIRNRSRL